MGERGRGGSGGRGRLEGVEEAREGRGETHLDCREDLVGVFFVRFLLAYVF